LPPIPRAMPSPVPVTVSMLGCARARCARTLAPPLKGDAVTSACDRLLGGLCLRSLRSHVVAAISCPCCCRPPRAMPSLLPLTDFLVGCARASCAHTMSPPSAILAVASRLPRAILTPVPVTHSLVGCACARCARTLSSPSAVLASAARLPRAMPSPVPVTDSLVGCACARCARTLSPLSAVHAVGARQGRCRHYCL
jgi:hypothetical protein